MQFQINLSDEYSWVNQEDLQSLIEVLLNKDASLQLSPFMGRALNFIERPKNIDSGSFPEFYIKPFIKYTEVIEALGWIEHTSDWDPAIEITFQIGDIIYTESGYSHMEINGALLMLDIDEDDTMPIPIDKITKIAFIANT